MQKRDLNAKLDQHSHVLEVSFHKILLILSGKVGVTSSKGILQAGKGDLTLCKCNFILTSVLSLSFSL